MKMNLASFEHYEYEPNVLMDYHDLLSIQDLATIFSVSAQTVYKELRNGKFGNPIRIGRAIKVPKAYIIKRYFHAQ